MKITDNLLIINSTDRLLIKWSDLPFDLNLSILWRGIYFALNIHGFMIQYGSTSTATFLYDKKKYAYSQTKWKYMGGHHGDDFPKIETSDHEIRFRLSLNYFEMVDKPKGSADKNDTGDTPFIVFPLS